MKNDSIYRITFLNQGNIYQLHARRVDSSSLYAFVEVAEIIFGERSEILVDPSEERLKAEFEDVRRTFIPMHAVIRIDEVSKEGQNRIVGKSEGGTVTPFPLPAQPKGRD
ncbi:DUF1820 family protein [Imhoffiella purpurea]|uniref:DUF1820 family protein n=1 Tax=Imhoffiella purpurea TaxID=1249627 RepID=W9VG03_9GAMM|nr:DUF1820 family protein [Imhoffiella purpurea]EXJ14967.1 hypothetical protein D779_1931 [Imhoffiella purpurea]